MSITDTEVLIIGGGISGLNCAHHLNKNNISFLVLEAEDRVGGRIKTDKKDGYLLDRGFQVLQTAYPAAREELEYLNLQLKPFAPGTVIRIEDEFHTVADPLRKPFQIFNTMIAPIGTVKDRFLLLRLAKKVVGGSLEDIFSEPEETTGNYLRNLGFSEKMIHRFFMPFFGGACLDRNIRASNQVFLYILKMFASGDASLPKLGMEQIPLQLAERLPKNSIQTNARVKKVEQGQVTLEDGSTIKARAIVIATEGPEVLRLLHLPVEKYRSVGEASFYFGCDKKPWHTPYLVLNGNQKGPINNLAVPSMVSSAYAPEGKSLINAVVLGDDVKNTNNLLDMVLSQLHDWYGDEVNHWQHLATYFIPHALPEQLPPTNDPHKTKLFVENGIFFCGEFQSLPAIQWALYSGKKSAAVVRDYLHVKTVEYF